MLTLILVVGLKKILHVNQAPRDEIVMLPPGTRLLEETDGEEKPEAIKGNGGGGSGQNNPRPVSAGILPDSAPHPPIVRPNPSNIPAPSLPMSATVVGPASEPQAVAAPIGFPNGNPGDFAPGPGEGGNIGTGKGNGAGSGTGGGEGPGSGGNKAGGGAGLPNGSVSRLMTDYDWALVKSKPGFVSFSFIHRPVPIVTPEARGNLTEGGYVLMRATFNSNGTITDIEVVSGIDYMVESAIESLKHSTFHPATLNGIPITVRDALIKVPISVRGTRR
jgi:protein TonB